MIYTLFFIGVLVYFIGRYERSKSVWASLFVTILVAGAFAAVTFVTILAAAFNAM